MKISDGKIINIADRLIQEEKIIWTIDIKAGTNERMTYIQSLADGQIMVQSLQIRLTVFRKCAKKLCQN